MCQNCASCGNKGAGVMLKADGDQGESGKRLLTLEKADFVIFFLSWLIFSNRAAIAWFSLCKKMQEAG